MAENSNNNNIPINIIKKGDLVTDENKTIILIAISELYKIDNVYCFDCCIVDCVDKNIVGSVIKRVVFEGYSKCEINISGLIWHN